jgi:hypothetical protein
MNRFTVIVFLSVIAAPFLLLDYNHFPYSDGAEHGAAVRALTRDFIHPGDPMLNLPDSASPRYVPSIFIMALCMRLSGLDVLVVLKLFEFAGFVFFLVSAAFFAMEYFNDRGQAPWSLACLLFLWGLGWNGANAYMFSAILYTAYYPSLVSFSLAFLALYFQLRFLHHKRPRFFVASVFTGAFCFVNHPVTGIFFFVCSGLIYLERAGLNKKVLACYTVTIITAVCFTLLWPYYNFFSSLMKVVAGEMHKTMDYRLTREYLYSQPLVRSGAALAGIPVVIYYLLQQRYILLWAGSMVFGFLYLCGFFVNISLAERCIFFLLCLLQLTTSRLCRELSVTNIWTVRSRINKIIYYVFILLLGGGIIIQAVLTVKEFVRPAFAFTAGSAIPHYVNPNAIQHELKKYLKDGDVVLSDIYSSWAVPVYTGAKIIALYHTAPHIIDNLQRIADVEAFYNISTPISVRTNILKKYGVTHIYLHYIVDGKQLVPILKELGYAEIVHRDLFSIFSVPK